MKISFKEVERIDRDGQKYTAVGINKDDSDLIHFGNMKTALMSELIHMHGKNWKYQTCRYEEVDQNQIFKMFDHFLTGIIDHMTYVGENLYKDKE
jgi:hypothetical protein